MLMLIPLKGVLLILLKRGLIVSAFYFCSTNTIFKRTNYLRSLILPDVKSSFSQVSITDRKIFIGKENSTVISERDRFLPVN